MWSILRYALTTVVCVFILSCTIDDDDRCTDGYIFDKKSSTCQPEEQKEEVSQLNEDHESTEVIPASVPLMITQNYVPSTQTGMMLFGTLFPSNHLDINYAITLSNGTDPMEEYFDLDNNKALGFRAKANYAIKELKLSLGGYFYLGQYTDSKDEFITYIKNDGSEFNDNVSHPLQLKETVTNKYDVIFKRNSLVLDKSNRYFVLKMNLTELRRVHILSGTFSRSLT